jgi:glycosyltransferase involved in cell wall biosynthesis
MTAKIKIARMITRMDLGGAQQAVLSLLQGLDSKTFEQIVITGQGGLLLPELNSLRGVKHYLVPELNRAVGPRNFWSDAQAVLKIRDILREERPLIAHTHTPKAGIVGRWAAWLANVPVILHTYHGFGFGDSHAAWRRQRYVSLERWTARITTRFVTVSEHNRTKGEQLGIFDKGRSEVIRSGIQFSKFQLQAFDKRQKKLELGLAPTDMVVGIVASLTPAKGLFHFLDAAAIIVAGGSNIRFLMVGDGELRPQIEAQIAQLRIARAVRVLGWRRDIPELMQIFDVLVLTSLWEGVPRVLVEAAVAGVPVVASNVDGVSEVVKDGENGILVGPGDAESTARATLELLRDEQRRSAMRRAGLSIVGDFSVEKMLENHYKMYQHLADTNETADPEPSKLSVPY